MSKKGSEDSRIKNQLLQRLTATQASQHTRWGIPGKLVPGVWALRAKRGVMSTLVDWDNSGICCHNHSTVLLMAPLLMLLMFVIAIHCHYHTHFINCYSYSMSLSLFSHSYLICSLLSIT